MRYAFGAYQPDLPALANPGLTKAKNVLPAAQKYIPMPALQGMQLAALSARARGAISGVTSAGVAFHCAGDETKLYKMREAGLVDASRPGGYHCQGQLRWQFSRFNNAVFAANPADPLQYALMDSQANFSDVVDGDHSVPRAAALGVVGLHLVVGNYYDTLSGSVPDGIRWSALGNPLSWPTPGTDLATSVQADAQPLTVDGGVVQAIVSGEVGGVFQEKAISRMDYRGGDLIYEIHRVEAGRGLLVPDLAVPFTRNQVLYLAEDGWYIWDYTGSRPIGVGVINQTFLADIQSQYFDRVSWAIHPDLPVVLIAYSGQGSTGNPNKLLAYNWAINQFSHPEVDLELVCQVIRPTLSMDSTPSDSMDAIQTSLDDRTASLGAMMIGGYTTAHELAAFTGPALVGELETGDVECVQGSRSLVNGVRPLVAGGPATVQVADTSKRDKNRPARYRAEHGQEVDGVCPARVDARYHRFRVWLRDGFTEAQGIDVDAVPSGGR